MFTKFHLLIGHVWSNITIEPVVAFYCLIIALSGIPGEELYLKKACKVNLNHSMEVCDNIYDHEEAQIETQKLVSGVQVNTILNFILLQSRFVVYFSRIVQCSKVFQG